MTVRELREKYLKFFESKGHLRVASGSLIPYDVTGRLDESLLFNGAGMVQFKPYFRGIAQPENGRLTNAQKCVRTGDIEEVGDDTHLTFFEMLGNFSFGDYFKAQAIAFSWEFLTSKEWLGLEPTRLSFTVFENDDDAYDEWAFWLTPAGIQPETRVFRLGEQTNYWPAGAFSSGPPGPCGPNSEMFYWVSDEAPPTGPYSREQWLADEGQGKWVEIWNDVFIQYEWQGELKDPSNSKLGYKKTGMPDLPFKSIDTGMGLERTAFVLGGQRSVYDTDAFTPIFNRLDAIEGKPTGTADEVLRARRIIADHIRTAVFCIADGILPGNTGRGYVLRRLIRRAVLKGQRVLGFAEPFFHVVYEGVVDAMGDHYTELRERRDTIVEQLRSEEALFRRTLDRGVDMLNEEVERLFVGHIAKEFSRLYRGRPDSEVVLSTALRRIVDTDSVPGSHTDADAAYMAESFPSNLEEFGALIHEARKHVGAMKSDGNDVQFTLPGRSAFRLYDTFGFPLEVTQELAAELGLDVDLDGYEAALKEAQERSRGERKGPYEAISVQEEIAIPDAPDTTAFLGYQCTDSDSVIVRVKANAAGNLLVALDRTPFYAESGGQVGDHGVLTLEADGDLEVVNTTKSAGTFWHEIGGDSSGVEPASLLGKKVQATVFGARRDRIRRNHTATHLLQAALRTVLGTHVTQAGSYVGPDNLRFDFTHGKGLSASEIEKVERMVNEQALANRDVQTYADLPIAEAKAQGAMALFGEKYGDKVRMVEIGDFSRELCGGIHVRSTGEIGLFKIVSESSAAGGVRRIEAITGEAAYEFVLDETKRLREAAALLKSSPKEIVSAVERTLEQARDERKRREKAEMAAMGGGGAADAVEVVNIGPVVLWRRDFGDVDPKLAAASVDNAAEGKGNQVTLASVTSGGRIQFICKVGVDAVTAGAHAGNLLREVAKITGGGGGGRADFATAGGKDPAKVGEAIAASPKILAAMIGVSND